MEYAAEAAMEPRRDDGDDVQITEAQAADWLARPQWSPVVTTGTTDLSGHGGSPSLQHLIERRLWSSPSSRRGSIAARLAAVTMLALVWWSPSSRRGSIAAW